MKQSQAGRGILCGALVALAVAANGYGIGPADGEGKAADHPVYNITWYEAVKRANARSEKEELEPCYTASGVVYHMGESTPNCNWSANGYRLPTEAEWEKAARGEGAGWRYPWSDIDEIDASRANYSNYYGGTTPVGSFAPNGVGLYDMAGNVWEWCWDWYGETSYASSLGSDSRGPASGTGRVLRGGSWYVYANGCRVANRGNYWPDYELGNLGLRLVRTAS